MAVSELADHRDEEVVEFPDYGGDCAPRGRWRVVGRAGRGGRQAGQRDRCLHQQRDPGVRSLVRSCSDGGAYWPNNCGQYRQPQSRHHARAWLSSAGQGATIAISQIRLPSHWLARHAAAVIRRCQRT